MYVPSCPPGPLSHTYILLYCRGCVATIIDTWSGFLGCSRFVFTNTTRKAACMYVRTNFVGRWLASDHNQTSSPGRPQTSPAILVVTHTKTGVESRSRLQPTSNIKWVPCSSTRRLYVHTLSTLPDFELVKNQCKTWPSWSRMVSTRDNRSFLSGKLSCHKFFIIHHDKEPSTSDSWLSTSPSSSMGNVRCAHSPCLCVATNTSPPLCPLCMCCCAAFVPFRVGK